MEELEARMCSGIVVEDKGGCGSVLTNRTLKCTVKPSMPLIFFSSLWKLLRYSGLPHHWGKKKKLWSERDLISISSV